MLSVTMIVTMIVTPIVTLIVMVIVMVIVLCANAGRCTSTPIATRHLSTRRQRFITPRNPRRVSACSFRSKFAFASKALDRSIRRHGRGRTLGRRAASRCEVACLATQLPVFQTVPKRIPLDRDGGWLEPGDLCGRKLDI